MDARTPALQAFLDAAQEAFSHRAHNPRAVSALSHIFSNLQTVAPQAPLAAGRLPACDHLQEITVSSNDPDLQRLMETFDQLEPLLQWRKRQGDCTGASENFESSHANAFIIGPGALEPRDDVWLGISLLGPNVCYPDHRHAPEEVYLVIGPGDFRQGHNAWVHVAQGETFYNPSNVVHAMRSAQTPTFALWALREKPATFRAD